jgi:cytoskeletal protein CcmA (bactofilin family)
MALWKDSSTTVKDPAKDPAKDAAKDLAAINLAPPSPFTNPVTPEIPAAPLPSTPEPRPSHMSASIAPIRDLDSRRKESVITDELTIEGKIEGSGNVRIAGKFKGEVNVQGNLVIEQGAMVTANVRAATITIAGTLEGNIEGAARVELLESGVLTGDVMADSLTVAAGSRMRGKAEFGWTDKVSRVS